VAGVKPPRTRVPHLSGNYNRAKKQRNTMFRIARCHGNA
jgi:hypothetical protein